MAGYTPNDQGMYTIPLVDFGRRLQNNFGLTIKEHPAFDTVDRVHSDNSYHYIPGGGAIDIQDWRPDVIDGVGWQTRTSNLRDMLRGTGAEVFGPGDLPGHDTHLHLAGFDGGKNLRLNEDQYRYFFGGNSGGQNAVFNGATGLTGGSPGVTPEPSVTDPNPGEQTVMSPSQVNAEYDRLRMAGDALGARNFGMEQHKRLFNKR